MRNDVFLKTHPYNNSNLRVHLAQSYFSAKLRIDKGQLLTDTAGRAVPVI